MVRFDDLIGVPYKLHGRTKAGFDCYGLVIEVCKRLGHKLSDRDVVQEGFNETTWSMDIFDKYKGRIAIHDGLEKTNIAEYGDILVFFDKQGRTVHIGVKLNKDDFIHCDCNGVHISKLSTYPRKWSAYKWQK